MHSKAILACNAQPAHVKKIPKQEPRTHTCRKPLAGGNKAGINTQVGCKRMGRGDLTSGVGSTCVRFIVLTVSVTRLAIADVDVIDVRVSLQCEDEAY